MAKIPIPCPQRVRQLTGKFSFSWIDHRLIREGHLDKLSCDEINCSVHLSDTGGQSRRRKLLQDGKNLSLPRSDGYRKLSDGTRQPHCEGINLLSSLLCKQSQRILSSTISGL